MKIKWLVVCVLLLAGCREKKAPLAEAVFPVYKVDLDKVDSVNMRDIFSAVELISLQKKAGYTITSPQLGLYKGNYYLWDDTEKRMFCFGPSGNFKYVTKEDGLKSINRNSASHRSRRVSIMDQLGYRYQKKWYLYQTFRTEVYHLDKSGEKTTAYRWDFGKYNDKDTVVRFEKKPLDELVEEQQQWLHENSAFALNEAKENERYVYVSVERIYKREHRWDFGQVVHLFYDKKRGDYKLFEHFENGMYLPAEMRMDDTCMTALVTYDTRHWFLDRELLDKAGKKVYDGMKKDDYPLVVKYVFKKD